MSSQVMSAVKRQLKDSAVTFTDEWFEACVAWVKESNPSSQVTQEFLKSEVMGQWLDVDLSDLNSSCLPPRLIDTKLNTLSGRYSLQVNCAEDIGESAYNQWNKLKKLENENTNVSADVDASEIKANWEPKARRCIYLTMTDGSQVVYGMELVPIPCLSVDLKIGTKVLISGPVDCRRGVFQLKPNNVRVLGGEVESLVEEYSRETVLQSRLNQQDAPNPPAPLPRPAYKKPPASQSSKLKAKSSGSASTQNNSYASQFRSTQSSSNFNSNSSNKWNGTRSTSASQGGGGGSGQSHSWMGSNSNAKLNEPLHPDLAGIDFDDDPFGDDDDDFMDIDESLLINQALRAEQTTQVLSQGGLSQNQSQSQRQPASSGQSNRANTASSQSGQSTLVQHWGASSNSNSSSKDTKFKPPPSKNSDTKFIPPPSTSTSKSNSTSSSLSRLPTKSAKLVPPPTTALNSKSSSNSSSFKKDREDPPVIDLLDDDDDFEFDSSMTDEMNICPPSKKMKTIPKSPYQYIKYIKDSFQDNKASFKVGQVMYVKACVSTLVSNIKMDTNGGWTLVVSLNDGSGFLEASMTSELLNRIIGFSPADMKRMKASPDPSVKAKISSGMSKLSATLCHMNGIFGITITARNPVISSFAEVQSGHVAALRERLALIS